MCIQRKVRVSALKMQEDGSEKKLDTPYTEEDEKKYYQQNSGAGYRKNSQDGLLFAMGGMILLSKKPSTVPKP